MAVSDVFSSVRNALTGNRVYGDPIERDGLVLITAATVSGGGGGGSSGPDGENPQGEGGGFGIRASPVGAYVIANGKVTWRPAVDVNRLAVALVLVAVASAWFRTRKAVARMKSAPATNDGP